MTFKVTFERTGDDGDPILDEFEGVVDMMRPKFSDNARIELEDGETEKVPLSAVIAISDENND